MDSESSASSSTSTTPECLSASERAARHRLVPRIRFMAYPFRFILSGQRHAPHIGRGRRTPLSVIEQMPLVLRGQIKIYEGINRHSIRNVSLASSESTAGAWRRVYLSTEYPRLAFKFGVDEAAHNREDQWFRQFPSLCSQLSTVFPAIIHVWHMADGEEFKRYDQLTLQVMAVERGVRLTRSIGTPQPRNCASRPICVSSVYKLLWHSRRSFHVTQDLAISFLASVLDGGFPYAVMPMPGLRMRRTGTMVNFQEIVSTQV